MQLTAEQFPDATLITVLESRIDAASAIAFKDRMRDLTTDGQGRVVLELLTSISWIAADLVRLWLL